VYVARVGGECAEAGRDAEEELRDGGDLQGRMQRV